MSLLANSEIFPAIGGALERVTWKDGYFYINGKPTFLTVGELHPARIPRELWRDRLWRVKQMGFNCIQMYVFWNSTEPKDGVWDFSDNSDLDAWLSLIQEMGMYAIVRPGPYSCAEWDHGGFPAWLTIKPGMVLRDYDAQYLSYVDRHLAKLYAIIDKHQIHKGGSVIMTQLENECFNGGWGTYTTPYTKHLYEQARAAGLEIPLFFSGLHHGSDPSGESPYPVGTSPWYSTEFWTGWIGKYGDMEPGMLYEKIRGTWKIIAFGGAGYCYYVAHGGTNFGYSGDTKEATYDYSSPIGEAGQFRNLYGPARRAALFAQSFSSILTSSTNAPAFATLNGNGGRVTTRKSDRGAIVFADNFEIPADKRKAAQHIAPTADALKVEVVDPGQASVSTKIKLADLGEFPKNGNLVIAPNDIRTVLVDLPWTAATRFEAISTNVLLRQSIGGLDTWVCYGTANDYGEIALKRTQALPALYSFHYPADATVREIMIDSGDGKKARFLIMNTALADRTWLVKDKLVVGAAFVREDGSAELPPEGGKLVVYQGVEKKELAAKAVPLEDLPTLANWQWRDGAPERQPGYDDSQWLTSRNARAMEAYDSYQNRYGWYRTTLKGEGDLPLSLTFMGKVGDAQVYLNGESADLKNLKLKAGDNSLAIFFKTWARPKMFAFTGIVGNGAARGLWGPTLAGDQPVVVLNDWKTLQTKAKIPDNNDFIKAEFDDGNWVAITYDPANKEVALAKGIHWLRGTFENARSLKTAVMYLPELPEHGVTKTLFVNGTSVPVARDMNQPVDLGSQLKPGPNSVVMRIEVGEENDQAWVRPQMNLWRCNEPLTWKFRSGLEGLDETAVIGRVTNWAEFLCRPWNKDDAPGNNRPILWRTTFEYHPKQWETVGLITTGLKAGHVWLNGHNLGECPQQVPLYMPEVWLKKGTNDLVVLDIWGAKPDQIKLQRYESRQAIPVSIDKVMK